MISLSGSWERAEGFFYVSIRDKTSGKIFRKYFFAGGEVVHDRKNFCLFT